MRWNTSGDDESTTLLDTCMIFIFSIQITYFIIFGEVDLFTISRVSTDMKHGGEETSK